MGQYIPGIGAAQGSQGLLVSDGLYALQLLSARSVENMGDDRALDPGEPIANRFFFRFRIAEAPEGAFARDSETGEQDELIDELVGKTVEHSIYVMTENHVSAEKAREIGLNELKDVINAVGASVLEDNIEWDAAIERGAVVSVNLKSKLEEYNGQQSYRTSYRNWRPLA